MTVVNIKIDSPFGYVPPTNLSGYVIEPAKMSAIPSGAEEVDGWKERNARNDHQQTRLFKVPWPQIHAFREWAIGYSQTVMIPSAGLAAIAAATAFNEEIPSTTFPTASVAQIQRILPAQDPVRPWLFCSDCEMVDAKGAVVQDPNNVVYDNKGAPVADFDGHNLIATTIAYADNRFGGGVVIAEDSDQPITDYGSGWAYFRLTYRPPEGNMVYLDDQTILNSPYSGNELGRYVIREEDFALDALPLTRLVPGTIAGATVTTPQMLTFVAGPPDNPPPTVARGVVPEAGTLQLATSLLKYTWLDVPDLPRAGFAACVGKINVAAFDGFNGAPTYGPETLLCLPWRFRPTRGIAGRVTWRIEYRFQFRATKWNRFPTPNGFFLASFGGDAGGPFVYDTADFSLLFTIPPPVKYF